MFSRISSTGPTLGKLLSAAAVLATLAAAAPAHADDWRDHERWEHRHEEREWRAEEWRRHHHFGPAAYSVAPAYVAPPGVVYAAPPGVVYAPPPVVYAPPAVPAVPSLNVVIPIR